MSTCENDEIWYIPGVKVPVVLRPLGNGTFKVLGEAYFHGTMHGEGLIGSGFKREPLILV